jgi:hypothetical protein
MTPNRFVGRLREAVRSCIVHGRAAKVVLTVAMLALTAGVARADFCIQLKGGPFSGDIGFFRFKGQAPGNAGDIVALAGRGAGLSPAFGSAIVAKDGSYLEVGAMFFIDADQGQFDVTFFPPDGRTGAGYGNFGHYGTSVSLTAKRVGCANEP